MLEVYFRWSLMSWTVAGVADLLGSGPKTAQELADASGYSASGLYRLLRLSTSSGVFAVDGPVRDLRTRFRNNNLSVLLRSDHPESIRHLLWSFGKAFSCFNHLVGMASPAAYVCSPGGHGRVRDHQLQTAQCTSLLKPFRSSLRLTVRCIVAMLGVLSGLCQNAHFKDSRAP